MHARLSALKIDLRCIGNLQPLTSANADSALGAVSARSAGRFRRWDDFPFGLPERSFLAGRVLRADGRAGCYPGSRAMVEG